MPADWPASTDYADAIDLGDVLPYLRHSNSKVRSWAEKLRNVALEQAGQQPETGPT